MLIKAMSAPASVSPIANANSPDRAPNPRDGARSVSAERSYYRPELDLLRFFAFISVFIFHTLPRVEPANHFGRERIAAWGFANFRAVGSFGVCLFFVLSSFLITELLIRERASSGKVDVKAFYIRRILRIWPLYFSFLLFGYLLGHFVVAWHIEIPRFVSFLVLAGNWYVASFGMRPNPIAPLWSISIEEQFYLTWPWLAKLGGRTAILIMSTSLIPVSCCTIYFLAHWGQKAAAACWYNSLVQFEFFALGALTALVLRGRIPSWRIGTRLCLMVLGAALWMMAEGLFHVRWATEQSGPTSRFIGYQFIGIGCISLLVAFLGIPNNYLPRALVYLGKVSYGLYVFHYVWFEVTTDTFMHILSTPHGTVAVAIRSLISIPIELLLTILTAAVSYRLIEKPFLKLKERFSTISSRAV